MKPEDGCSKLWRSQVEIWLFDTIIMWCAINKTKPTHRCPTLNSSLYFWWWNFITKGWITWSWMWSVFSLCGSINSTWPSQACPFHVAPLLSKSKAIRSPTFLQWVWNFAGIFSVLRQWSFLPWLICKGIQVEKCRKYLLNTQNIL